MPPLLLTTRRRSRLPSRYVRPPAPASPASKRLRYERSSSSSSCCHRLRHRIDAMRAATVSVPGTGPTVDSAVLSAIAVAIRVQRAAALRLRRPRWQPDRTDCRAGAACRVGPPLVPPAWDVDRDDWRTFRVDRITPKTPTGPRFKPRTLSDDEAASRAALRRQRDLALPRSHPHPCADHHVRALLPLAVDVSSDGPDRCIIEAGSDTPHQLALYIGLLDTDFEILEPADLAEAFVRLAERYSERLRPPCTPTSLSCAMATASHTPADKSAEGMSGIRRVALAVTGGQRRRHGAGQAVPIQVRGSSLFFGRLSRASGGMRIAPSTGASSGRSARSRAMRTASRRAPSSSTRPASSASGPSTRDPGRRLRSRQRTLASSSDLPTKSS